MSQEIDERIVRMQFDNEQFERGIRQSTQSMENFDKTLNMQKSMKDPLQDISMNVEKLTSRFSLLGEVIHNRVYNVIDGLVGKVERMVKSVSVDQISAGMSKYSKKTTAVATIQSALPNEDIETIYSSLEKLNKYTDETSYDFTNMVDNIGKFTAAGIGLEEAEAAMEGIASATAKAGGNASAANRVMYNFSQAMGQGYVALMDWMSVENANVATKEFKQTIIDTAVEMGVLKKVGDKIKTKKGTEVDYKNFRGTLNEKWFTKDILVATLAKYSDKTTKFGMDAFLAAQQARTFEDAINAVKDAVSTGWMTTFELMFGNVDEATKLWTDLCNAIIELIAPVSEFRNEMLSFWKENGGRSAILTGITSAASGFHGIILAIVDALRPLIPGLEEGGSAAEFFGQKMLDWSNKLQSTGLAIRKALGYYTDTQITGYGEKAGLVFDGVFGSYTNDVDEKGNRIRQFTNDIFELADGLETLATAEEPLKNGSKGELVKVLQTQLKNMGYGDLLGSTGVDGIFGPKTQKALETFQKDIGEKVTGIFDPKNDYATLFGDHIIGEGEEKTTYRFGETLEKVRTIASGFWAVIRLAAKAIGDFFKLMATGSGTVLGSFGNLLDTFSWLSKYVVSFTNWIYEKDIFGWITTKFGGLVKMITGSKLLSLINKKVPKLGWLTSLAFILSIVKWLSEKVPNLMNTVTSKLSELKILDRIKESLEKVSTSAKEFFANISGKATTYVTEKLIPKITTFMSEKLPEAIDWITEKLSKLSTIFTTLTMIPEFFRDIQAFGENPSDRGIDQLMDKYREHLPLLSKIFVWYKKIKGFAVTTWENAKTKFEEYKTKIKESAAWNWLTKTFENIRNSIAGWLDDLGILDTVTSIFDDISAAVQNAINWIRKFLGLRSEEEEAADAMTKVSSSMIQDGQFITLAVNRAGMTEEERKQAGLEGWVKGDRGKDIKRTQEALIHYGYGDLLGDAGADGIYGKNTQKALEQFYKDHPYSEEGIAVEEGLTIWQKIGDVLQALWQALKDKVQPYIDKVRGWFDSAYKWLTNDENGDNIIDRIWNWIKSWLGIGEDAKGKEKDVGFLDVVSGLFGKIVNFAADMVTKIFPAISKIAGSGLVNLGWIGGILGFIAVITAVYETLQNIALIKNKNAGLPKKSVFEGIGEILQSMAICMLALSVSLKIISTIKDPKAAIDTMFGMVGIMIALSALSVVFQVANKRFNGAKGMSQASNAILKMVGALAILSILVWALSKMDITDIALGIAKLSMIAALALGIQIAMVAINNFSKKSGNGMVQSAKALQQTATAMLIMAASVALLGMLPWTAIGRGLVALAGVALIAIGLTAAIRVINMIPVQGTPKKMTSIMSMALSILLLAGTVIALAYIPSDKLKQGVLSLLAIAGIATAMYGVVTAIGKSIGSSELKSLGKSLLGLIPVVVLLGAFVASVILLKDVNPEIIDSMSRAVGALSIMLVAVGGMVALSGIGGLEGVGAAMLALIGVIGVIAAVLWAMSHSGISKTMISGATALGTMIGSFLGSIESAKLLSIASANEQLAKVDPIDKEKLDTLTNNATQVSDFFKTLPSGDFGETLIGTWLGQNESHNFVGDVQDFCTAMRNIYDAFSGLDDLGPQTDEEGNITDPNGPLKTKVDNAVAMATGLNTLFKDLPEEQFAFVDTTFFGGVITISKVDQFCKDLQTFIDGMAEFSNKMLDPSTTNSTVFTADAESEGYAELTARIDNAIAVAETMATFMKNDLPDVSTETMSMWMTRIGDYDNYTTAEMASFGSNLLTFVSAMNAFNNAVVGDEGQNGSGLADFSTGTDVYTKVEAALVVAKDMASFIKNDISIPSMSEIDSFNGKIKEYGPDYTTGTISMKAFGGNLMYFVIAMNDIATELNSEGIGTAYLGTDIATQVNNAVGVATSINDLIKTISDTGIGEIDAANLYIKSDNGDMYAYATKNVQAVMGDIVLFAATMDSFFETMTSISEDEELSLADKLAGKTFTTVKTATDNAIKIATAVAEFEGGAFADLTIKDRFLGIIGQSTADKMAEFAKTVPTFVTSMATALGGLDLSGISIDPDVSAKAESMKAAMTPIAEVFTKVEEAVTSDRVISLDQLITEINSLDLSLKGLLEGATDPSDAAAYVTALNDFITAMNLYSAEDGGFTQIGVTIEATSPEETAASWLLAIEAAIDTGLETYHPVISAVVSYDTDDGNGNVQTKAPTGLGTGKTVRSSGLANDINNNSSSGVGDVNTTNNYSTSNAFNISNSVYVTGNTLDVNNDAWYSKVASKLMTYINRNNRNYGAAFGSMP